MHRPCNFRVTADRIKVLCFNDEFYCGVVNMPSSIEERPPVAPAELMGVPGSPYTRKMLALMRYRRIPYRLLPGSRHLIEPESGRFRDRPEAKVPLLPTYYFTDSDGEETAVTDSSLLLRRFERDYTGRSVIPEDPVLALIDFILEDYADEWLTKAMFHYRWTYRPDIEKAAQMLPRWHNTTAGEEDIAKRGAAISERQITRLSYVGSNETTAPTIESSFKRFIQLLDAHLQASPFLLGKRPASCDFAVYGQLTCLALFDPTPQAIILEQAPRVYAWVEVLEDISGYELMDNDWIDPENLPPTLSAMLGELGRIYAPYLLANAEAVESSADKMETTLDGRPWVQNPFPYQAKCLRWIRDEYRKLTAEQKQLADGVFAGSGLDRALTEHN